MSTLASVPVKRKTLLVLALLASFILLLSNIGIQGSLSAGFIANAILKQHRFDEGLDGTGEAWRTRVSWSSEWDLPIPQTNIVVHAPGTVFHSDAPVLSSHDYSGWTIFDNLYVMNGTVFVVTDAPETIPPRKTLTSTGIEIKGSPELVKARLPTDREMRIISPEHAIELFGSGATLIDGITVSNIPQIQRFTHVLYSG